MYDALKKVDGIRPVPSQANYIMVEITNGMTAKEVTKRMLLQHNMVIKNLFAKIQIDNRQFLRLAVRTQEENEKMIQALAECLAAN